MGGRWNMFGFQAHKVLWVVFMVHLQADRCMSLNLEEWALLKFRPRVEVDPHGAFRNWDAKDIDPCNLSGVHCIDGKVETLNLKDLSLGGILAPGLGKLGYLKSLFKFKTDSSSHGHRETNVVNLPSFTQPCTMQNINVVNSFRRKLLQENSNLPASPVTGLSPQEVVTVPSIGSGSFPAVPNSNNRYGGELSSETSTHTLPSITVPPHQSSKPTNTIDKRPASIGRLGKWAYFLVLPGVGLLLAIVASMLACRKQGVAAIGPWKTGLSGQLQKAFITGVPKLNRSELEAACEDFSNIIITLPVCTIFKGTLSSGVEIAVVSTCVSSAKDWSRRSEMRFRKMVDTLSQVNHKNFVNLLGYCEENTPFVRMMVFEYAPNGTLFEHLHVKEFEHLDWSVRMRIIMGMAYCLQYMHHELNPPVTLTDLQSNAIFMTDDYAAKIAETSIWKEVAKRRVSGDDDMDPSEPPFVELGSNVYGFGMLMLEVISGKLPYSEKYGSLLNWATNYLHDKRDIGQLVDPTLKSFNNEELDIVVEVIQECINQDPKNRPTMKSATARLREVIAISPDAASPRLSPLWWAELEILSVEAS